MMAGLEAPFRVFKLAAENELRVLVGDLQDIVRLKLLNGKAEIFGTEMVVGTVYAFPPKTSISVHTWHGCDVKVSGKAEDAFVVNENQSMILNCVLHSVLEERRCIADLEDTKGPRTLIVGPTNAGKSTLCRYLLNYSSRMGRKPLFIDLDVGQNSISIPGSIGVLTIEKPADIVTGFDEQAVQVYQFGYKSPGSNLKLYFLMLNKLGQFLKSGLQNANKNVRTSGVVINSCGWVRGNGYRAITFAAMIFEIDVLCVIAEERLYNQLRRDMPSCVEILFIPKLEGAIERSRPLRISSRDARVREYFYGPTNLLRPFTFEVTYSEIQVLRANCTDEYGMIDEDRLPNLTPSDASFLPVPLRSYLVNHVLAVSSADSVNEDLLLTHVLGFICVSYVDMDRGVIRVVSPQPSPLPKRILIMGDIKAEGRFD